MYTRTFLPDADSAYRTRSRARSTGSGATRLDPVSQYNCRTATQLNIIVNLRLFIHRLA